jgi:putative hydrolase of the HAD superfamily
MQSSNSAENNEIAVKKIQIDGIIFDYGNVLCHPQQASDVENMAKVCGIPLMQFQESYWKFRSAYDRADIDGKSYWAAMAGEHGVRLSQDQIAELIALDTASWARENEDAVGWAQQLHNAGFPLALLSNMPHELSRSLTSNGKWAKFFQHRIFSCDLRRNKPDPLIYQSCLDALSLAADKVLFLDDIPANVESASRLGIRGVVFDTLEGTCARVAEKFNLPVPAVSSLLRPG